MIRKISLFLLITLSLLVVSCGAQSPSSGDVQDVISTNEQLLREMAATLGVTIEFLWGVLTKQAVISAYRDVAWALLWVIYYWFYGTQLQRFGNWITSKERNTEEGKEIIAAIGLVIGGIVFLFSFIWVLEHLYTVPTRLMNPDYWALEQILQVLR